MKNLILILLVFTNGFQLYSQEKTELIKFNCFKNMPIKIEDLVKQDTIFILFQASKIVNFEQIKNNIHSEYTTQSYNFLRDIHFPMQIYDYQGFEKVNFNEPKLMFERKSFLCRNMYRTIDVIFMRKNYYDIFYKYFATNRVIYIIELDVKIKNKYKIVQVNNPEMIME